MFSLNQKQKAFTLAEIFIAMVVLSVLVSVCLTFFVKRHDYEREYFYYTAYRNIVNVVDSALMNDSYIKGTSARVEKTNCGTNSNPSNCRAFKASTDINTGLCSIFKDYFNLRTIYNSSGSEVSPCQMLYTAGPTPSTNPVPSLSLTNGIDIYFSANATDTIIDLQDATLTNPEQTGYTFWVDINGMGEGEDKSNYDIFKFYITRSGRVIPAYGSVSGIRGYEYIPADMDGGGNNTLAAFDVIFSPEDVGTSTVNHYKVVEDGTDTLRSLPFPQAACASGYISDATDYCKDFKYNCNPSTGACSNTGVTKTATCGNDYADCKIRLVKKLRRLK